MRPDRLVGVVVPVFNAERWLGQALDSVLAQGHRPLDVVVVDDGSSDTSAAVAERYGPPVRVVSQRNAGIGAARNTGAALVDGDLLTFIDADDLWTGQALEPRVAQLARQTDIDIVFGHVRRFTETTDGAPVPLDEAVPAHLPSAMLVRRTAFERVGPFTTGLRVAESLDWVLRARELGLGEATLPDQVLWRRVHGENNSLRHRAALGEFTHVLKASLDRRRALHTDRDRARER